MKNTVYDLQTHHDDVMVFDPGNFDVVEGHMGESMTWLKQSKVDEEHEELLMLANGCGV